MHTSRAALAVLPLLLVATAAPPALGAGAPGWSTPHTASAVKAAVYGAGPNGQGVVFAPPGAIQTRTASMRAIKSDATEGTAKTVDAAGELGFDGPSVAVNAGGKLVAAWMLDTQQTGPIGLAATLGARTGLPRTATVLPVVGNAGAPATEITADGVGIVAWQDGPPTAMKVATMRVGQAPQIATVGGTDGVTTDDLAVGLDAGGRPVVTWTETAFDGSATVLRVARGDGAGGFAPALALPLTTGTAARADVVVLSSGALTVVWSERPGLPTGPATIRTADVAATPGSGLGPIRTLATTAPGWGATVAGALNGRVAVLYGVGPGGSTGASLRIVLRSTSGNWGSAHAMGPSGTRTVRSAGVGVDASGRTVVLWDDGPASSNPTRILGARSSSSSNPPGSYHQLAQRSGDSRCAGAKLILSTSGDGLGSWQCDTSTAKGQPRLARLTKAS